MFCGNCGSPLKSGNLFCENCGDRIASQYEEETQPVIATAEPTRSKKVIKIAGIIITVIIAIVLISIIIIIVVPRYFEPDSAMFSSCQTSLHSLSAIEMLFWIENDYFTKDGAELAKYMGTTSQADMEKETPCDGDAYGNAWTVDKGIVLATKNTYCIKGFSKTKPPHQICAFPHLSADERDMKKRAEELARHHVIPDEMPASTTPTTCECLFNTEEGGQAPETKNTSQTSNSASYPTLPSPWRYPEESDYSGNWQNFRKKIPVPFHAQGDFNGDGIKDNAWILIRTDTAGWGLFVVLSSSGGNLQLVQLDDTQDGSTPQSMGISLLSPGKYPTTCGTGIGDGCTQGEPAEITLTNYGIKRFFYQVSSSYFYWDESSNSFKEEWTSD